METKLELQILSLALAAALGLGLGLLYDLIRPLRRKCGRLPAALLDLFFCLGAVSGLFMFAMGAGTGRLGTWELALALLGFLAYIRYISPLLLPFFMEGLELFLAFARGCKKIIKNTAVSAKKLFQKVRECIIIKKKC